MIHACEFAETCSVRALALGAILRRRAQERRAGGRRARPAGGADRALRAHKCSRRRRPCSAGSRSTRAAGPSCSPARPAHSGTPASPPSRTSWSTAQGEITRAGRAGPRDTGPQLLERGDYCRPASDDALGPASAQEEQVAARVKSSLSSSGPTFCVDTTMAT